MKRRFEFLLFLAIGAVIWVSTRPTPTQALDAKMVSEVQALVTPVIDDTQYVDGTLQNVIFYSKQHAGSNEKIARKGQLVKKPGAKATVLICHGFMCDKYDIGFLRSLFPDCNTMTFDFRAHGESRENQCCTLGRDEALDVVAAAEYLKSQPDIQNKPLLVYGFSMGAVAAILAQSEHKLFDAMILDCPFDSSEKIIQRGLENMKFTFLGQEFEIPGRRLLEKYAFHPYVQSLVKTVLKAVAKMDSRDINMFVHPIVPSESIKKVDVPCFFIHCKKDQRVSVDSIKSIYESAGSDYKVLWLTNGRWHFDSFFYNPEKYTALVKNFVTEVHNGTLKKVETKKIIEDRADVVSRG